MDKKIYTQDMVLELKPNTTYEQCIFDELDLSGRKLEECEFTNCSFVSAKLTGTRFNNSVFTNCNLANATITGCNFFSCTFKESKLLGLQFPACESLIGVTFEKCILDYANFRSLDLKKMDFSHSSCIETDFSLANLDRVSFMNADLSHAVFNGVKFHMTDMRGATVTGFSLKNNVKGIILTPKQLQDLGEAVGITILES
jgi:uncharacterized protein YjbI with pentapeptide repeats